MHICIYGRGVSGAGGLLKGVYSRGSGRMEGYRWGVGGMGGWGADGGKECMGRAGAQEAVGGRYCRSFEVLIRCVRIYSRFDTCMHQAIHHKICYMS